jgi:hypothetical protein
VGDLPTMWQSPLIATFCLYYTTRRQREELLFPLCLWERAG